MVTSFTLFNLSSAFDTDPRDRLIDDYGVLFDDNLQKNINEAFSKIDKAVKKGVLHRNNGANKKSRLNAAVKKLIDPAIKG